MTYTNPPLLKGHISKYNNIITEKGEITHIHKPILINNYSSWVPALLQVIYKGAQLPCLLPSHDLLTLPSPQE